MARGKAGYFKNIGRYRGNGTPDVYQNILYNPEGEKPFYSTVTDMAYLTDCKIDSNVYFNAEGKPAENDDILIMFHEKGFDQHSIYSDPLFEDLDNGNFRLKPNSPALKLGIKQIDFENIGLTAEFPERFMDEYKLISRRKNRY